MSVYSGYPSHAVYVPPPPAPTHAPISAYQPPHSVLQSDPNTFRQFYSAHLATLTFNSRPIIQNLSMMAQDFQRWASIVAQCLDAHIRRVPPAIKLPAFYLLDSISKNIFDPYAGVFSSYVVQLFLDSHRIVDPVTQNKMEEMLVTWRTGAPNGRELFGVSVQVQIERVVWGSGASTSTHDAYHHAAQPHPTKRQVLAELEVAIAQKERVLHSHPDSTTAQHVEVLYRLRHIVQSSELPPKELAAITDQLQAMTGPPASAPPNAYATPTPPPSFGFTELATYPPSTAAPPVFVPAPTVHPYSAPAQPTSTLNNLLAATQSILPSTSVAPSTTSTPAGTALKPNDIASLFNSLVNSGIFRPDITAATTVETPPVNSELEAARQYERTIMSMTVHLYSTDLVKQRPQIVPLLYNQLPLQCKQCALRFSSELVGKKRMQDHLDMHFRQNRKASQNVGRGHSRSWFVGVDDWTHDNGSGDTRKPSAKATANAAAADREAKLKSSFVVVPVGEEAQQVFCPICKEQIPSQFVEDDEEWVWKNAVRVQDRIYHATCHADAMSASNPLLQRLRADARARSRSKTPETTTPPLAIKNEPMITPGSPRQTESRGVKRKADEDSFQVKEEDRTPPLKRVALSA